MKRIRQHPFLLLIILFNSITAITIAQSTCAPVLTYDSEYNLCAGQGSLNMTVSVGIPAGCAHLNPTNPFDWKGPGSVGETDMNQESILNPQQGEYSVEITLIQNPLPGQPWCPCIGNHESNIITVNPIPSMPDVTEDTVICGGATILTAVEDAGDPSGGNFLWYDNADNLLFSGNGFNTGNLLSSTSFKVSYSVNGCESPKRLFTVIVNPLPAPIVEVDTFRINCNNSIMIEAISLTGDIIHWYEDASLNNLIFIGSQFQIPVILDSKSYFAVNVAGECRSAPTEVIVQVFFTEDPIVVPIESCLGEEVVLTAEYGSPSLGSGIFEWYSEAEQLLHVGFQFDLPSIYTDNIGDYVFKVRENNNGCSSGFSLQSVRILGLPSVEVADDFIQVCEASAFTLSATSNTSPIDFHWSGPFGDLDTNNGADTTVVKANKGLHEGIYNVFVTDNNGCSSTSEQVIVQVIAQPNLGLFPGDTIKDGEDLQLYVSGADIYEWFPEQLVSNANIPNPYFEYEALLSNDTAVFTIYIKGTDFDNSCMAFDSTTIVVVPNLPDTPTVRVYDVLTPNRDGFNDVWEIEYLYNLENYVITVFDNRSQIVYYFDEADGGSYEMNKWNGGRFNNSNVEDLVPTGTYLYSITSDNSPPITGLITVLSH
jgi:gliding motility-associated-like protein